MVKPSSPTAVKLVIGMLHADNPPTGAEQTVSLLYSTLRLRNMVQNAAENY